jgi:predicted ATP-binding protein involved in virulence
MHIEKVMIKNFKAVKEMELEFTPGVNLIIGDNGVGKTSVLEAIVMALYGILKGVSGVPIKNIPQTDIHFSVDERGDASTEIHYETPTEIICDMKIDEQKYHWMRYRIDESGNTRTKLEEDGIVKWMKKISNESNSILPLICFQSDARVWQMRRGDFGKELKKKLNDRRCGYIGCLDYSLDIKGIQAWCLKMELNAFQKKQKIKEYEAFKKIIATFMQQISGLEHLPEIYYSSQLEELVYREENSIMPISSLSSGYQSLLWTVMNLAYRIALLNPEHSKNLNEIEGIVLIDEIDMHLHPKWQWNIINALESTFPNVQFILATHSPLVISSCKNKRLIMITDDRNVIYQEDAYGFSVQDVLNFRQGTTEKPKKIKELTEQFEEAIEWDELDKAEKLIDKMAAILGEDHVDVCSAREELELNRWEED